MVKRVLAWIRHGEYAQPPGVPSAHLPYGLTSRGRDQAVAAARAVRDFARERQLELDPVIDCSRLRRAWETASLIADELARLGSAALQVEEFEALAERGLGAAANLTVDAIEALLAADPRYGVPAPGWKRDPDYKLPLQGAESLGESGERVARHVLERMRGTRSASLKLFIGHGGAFRHAARSLGLLNIDDVQSLSMHHGVPIYFEHRVESGPEVVAEGAAPPAAPGASLIHLAGEWRQRTNTTSLD